jgi:exosortase/archaeosortase family protein
MCDGMLISRPLRYYAVLGSATIGTVLLYPNQVMRLFYKGVQVASGDIDFSVPSYPLLALFTIGIFIFARRFEVARSFSTFQRGRYVRILGLTIALSPFAWMTINGRFSADSYALAGAIVASSWFGLVFTIRPASFRVLWPYLLAYVAGVLSVDFLTTVIGNALSAVEAHISAFGTALAGLPVHWTAASFGFTTVNGQSINMFISEECSGTVSFSIFLLLVAMMHIDLRARILSTIRLAILGILALLLVNALRIVIIIWGGYIGGIGVLNFLHIWLGYGLYIMTYVAAIALYLKTGRKVQPSSSQ